MLSNPFDHGGYCLQEQAFHESITGKANGEHRLYEKLGRGLPMVYQETVRLNRTLNFENDGEVFKVVIGL